MDKIKKKKMRINSVNSPKIMNSKTTRIRQNHQILIRIRIFKAKMGRKKRKRVVYLRAKAEIM